MANGGDPEIGSRHNLWMAKGMPSTFGKLSLGSGHRLSYASGDSSDQDSIQGLPMLSRESFLLVDTADEGEDQCGP